MIWQYDLLVFWASLSELLFLIRLKLSAAVDTVCVAAAAAPAAVDSILLPPPPLEQLTNGTKIITDKKLPIRTIFLKLVIVIFQGMISRFRFRALLDKAGLKLVDNLAVVVIVVLELARFCCCCCWAVKSSMLLLLQYSCFFCCWWWWSCSCWVSLSSSGRWCSAWWSLGWCSWAWQGLTSVAGGENSGSGVSIMSEEWGWRKERRKKEVIIHFFRMIEISPPSITLLCMLLRKASFKKR